MSLAADIIAVAFVAFAFALTIGAAIYEVLRAWWLKRYGPVPLGFEKQYADFRARELPKLGIFGRGFVGFLNALNLLKIRLGKILFRPSHKAP